MKGILDFVEGFVVSPQLNVPLTIIGDGPDRPIIERLIGQDSRVRLLGQLPREAVYQTLGRTNIFVFPSVQEGHSLSLTEAMATGHACVVRNTPSLVETLGQGNGLVCDSVPEMVRAVEALVRDAPRRFDLQMRAVRRSGAFSWEDTAERILNVWGQLAQEGMT
jgi:glycosyltransferase involved in cell wall biosynthesis